MSDILNLAVSALHADQAKLEQISLNAAHASTPGYRRGVVSAVAFESVLRDAEGTAQPAQPLLAPPMMRRSVDLTSGAQTQTGRALDVAVEGGAFLMLTDGQHTWLTRAGSMQVDAQGTLTGVNGLHVVGTSGDIRVGQASDVEIDGKGQVHAQGNVVGTLRLVKATEPRDLASTDGLLFQVSGEQYTDIAAGDVAVKPGFLESSNSNSLQDMLGTLEGVRHFEGLIRLVQGYDEVVGKAIQKLGDI